MPGTTIVPPAYTQLALGAAGRRGSSPSTSTRPASCSTRRATRRAPTASGPCPTASRSAPCGCSPAATRSTRSTRWTSSRSGSPTSASTSEVTAMDSNKLGDVILEGNYDAFQWDWYVEPDPDGILADFTCDQRGGLVGLVVLRQGVRRALQAAERRDGPGQAGRDRQADAADALRGRRPTSSRRTPRPARPCRSDRFACFQPQPDPGGVWLVQYGAHNYTLLRPADEAGDCDGVTSALEPASASSEQSRRGRRRQQRGADRRRRGRAAAGRRRRGLCCCGGARPRPSASDRS